jgi:hypothetical protein
MVAASKERLVPDPIKAMEMMNQLNLEGGNEPSAKARSTANDRDKNPETAKKFDSALDKARAEVKEFINKGPKSTPIAYSDTGPRPGVKQGGFGGAGSYGDGDIEKGMMGSRMPKPKMKSGGVVKSASARADGCCIRGKTRA